MLADSVETNVESKCDAAFKAAVDLIQNMPKKGVISISVNQKLRFYSLFKQGVNGTCNVPCPPLWRAVDRMKWRAWNALGSMDSLEAKKIYVTELKDIINRVQHEYDVAELTKESDERTKELLKEKLTVLGYDVSVLRMREDLDDFEKQSCNTAEGNYEMKKHTSSNGTNELSDQCSESSTSTGEYVDAVCCNHEPCVCCRRQPPNQRTDPMNGRHSFSSTFDSENLKIFMQRHLKIIRTTQRRPSGSIPPRAASKIANQPHSLRFSPVCSTSFLSRQPAREANFYNQMLLWHRHRQAKPIRKRRFQLAMNALKKRASNVKHQIAVIIQCFIDTNVQLLLTRIDNLEQMKGVVSETLLDVVDKRIAYPKMITSYVSEAGKFRIKRMEEAELVWQTESMGKRDVEKMMEIINKVKETEKENDAFLHRLEEV
ncbi:hypothetical protein LOAG_07515 [Loa loa]|uniref:ACB domain-containing protein n=1 Tax=Loa loa TaxID=7209 RepID=A0A1S0TVK4_LOALO|nr:hypothetical protein LOAG_07515 [Loa loa]EFO20975.1 hypothetical protein LOAG_07515 [Loa loa]